MSNAVIVSVVVMLFFIMTNVPVFAAILGGSMMYFVLSPDVNNVIFAQKAIVGSENINLLAIPFFIFAGALMNYSGVTKRIMDFCEMVTGRMRGGLAQVNVLLSTLMGGLSGSNLADAAMEAKLLVPQMEQKGFSKAFSSVLTATTSMITPLIPPGIAMILYGCIGNVSIGKLFVSGFGIGLILCIGLMLMVSVISKKRGYLPIRSEKLTRQQIVQATKPAVFPLLMPILIIGGIRIGVFTATEAGSVAIVYAIILGLYYREMRLADLCKAVKETVVSTSGILLIIAAATVLSWIMAREQVPQQLTTWMLNTISNKYVFLLATNLFLLVVGMFVEGNAYSIVLIPLLAPVAAAYGIDEIHFAMIYIFNGSIGALTPPLGTLMFVTCGITKCKTRDFIKEAVPFYLFLIIILVLLTFCPFFSTALVNLIY